jgi:UDP-glucose 4-epimerase
MNKNKIIVTGACGYIGSHTVIELWQQGFEVIGIDNYSRSHTIAIDLLNAVSSKKLVNYAIDLKNKADVFTVFEQHKDAVGVIHFAAYKTVPESVAQPALYYENNLHGLLNVIDAIQHFNIPNFVFSSSCSVYGNATTEQVNEQTPIGIPISPYAATKQMGERIIQDYYKNFSGRCMLLRYFNPVGAHQSGEIGEMPFQKPDNLFPLITGAATGKYPSFTIFGTALPTKDGTCIRDYIHVSDIAAAHVKAMMHMLNESKTKIEILNLGSGIGYSIKEIIAAIEKESGQKLNIIYGEPRSGDVVAIYADASKAKEVIGWEPKLDLAAMCKTALSWEKKWQAIQNKL